MSLSNKDESIITVKGLCKAFNNKKAVDDLSFDVKKGELFAFLGQNGAGKSTTINMLIGLLKKDKGTIFYNSSEDFNSFKPNIGVVFQNNIFDELLTVEENLLMYGALYIKEKNKLKQKYEEISLMFNLNDFLKKRFKILSGGQKRKAEIARAMFTSPKILFLDEPTTGLDPKTRAEVWNLLKKIRKEKGMTVFLTTHYMEETADADQVVIIHKGEKVCCGSPAELKSKYSYDKILITPNETFSFEEYLQKNNIEFSKTADTYAISLENTQKSIELLYELKDNIKFYEVKKGTMDDVFLNAVGESIRKEYE